MGELEEVLSEIIESENHFNAPKQVRSQIRQEGIGLLARLRHEKENLRQGLTEYQDHTIQMNIIRKAILGLVSAVQEGRIGGGAGQIRQGATAEGRDFMDKIFKVLLLGVFLISFSLIIRAVAFSDDEFTERLFQLSISGVGCCGGFVGYFRWRSVELGNQESKISNS